jgi:hypothetical protein
MRAATVLTSKQLAEEFLATIWEEDFLGGHCKCSEVLLTAIVKRTQSQNQAETWSDFFAKRLYH